MCARPRTVSDKEILEATARVVARRGPLRATLAEIGEELRVTPAAIVQRFGSKRDLLLALAASVVGTLGTVFERARRGASTAVEALLDALAACASAVGTPEEFSNSLGFLQLDLTDPGFRHHAQAYFAEQRRHVRALLQEALDGGELEGCDAEELARGVQVAYNGALLAWAMAGDGAPSEAVRRDVAALLAPYRRRGPLDALPVTPPRRPGRKG